MPYSLFDLTEIKWFLKYFFISSYPRARMKLNESSPFCQSFMDRALSMPPYPKVEGKFVLALENTQGVLSPLPFSILPSFVLLIREG